MSSLRSAWWASFLRLRRQRAVERAERLERLSTKNPDDAMLLVRLAEALRRTDQATRAFQCYLRAARIFEARGINGRALALYKLVAESSPPRPETALMLAGCFERLGEAAEARRQVERAAEACEQEMAPDLAAELRRFSTETDPLDAQARLRLAEYHLDRDGIDEGVKMLRSALRILRAQKKDTESAIVARKILGFVPADRGLTVLAVKLLLEGGDRAAAFQVLQQHFDAAPPEPQMLVKLGRWASERPRTRASLQVVSAAARAYLRNGSDARAVEACHRILALFASAPGSRRAELSGLELSGLLPSTREITELHAAMSPTPPPAAAAATATATATAAAAATATAAAAEAAAAEAAAAKTDVPRARRRVPVRAPRTPSGSFAALVATLEQDGDPSLRRTEVVVPLIADLVLTDTVRVPFEQPVR
ncbi:MAG: hypothetical protein IT384_26265 [Deltaproteobacteria bacterium]|nr:hypothetical protein [Deltaproteobacteria bacterium]